ncbi:MAG: thymidine phosphorylase [Chloroflexi bacterium]|nr:thymidine phosphorylase [Chloroflexota bacterium]
MRAVDLIQKKRRGGELSGDEIRHFVAGCVDGSIRDYQTAAWLMAICCQGMTFAETVELTRAMAESGASADPGELAAWAVDKHSTGGVGDKTTLVVAPLVAAAGVPVAKMSGRGLGFSGGTLDKLESIPGLRVDLSAAEFQRVLATAGLVISGQTAGLAPADAKLYALRDVTATVDCLPLIASSIMSKKIAGGARRMVLDVKVGSGAFMKTLDEAAALAQTMVAMGEHLDRQVVAVVSDMSQPLGRAVGNALEVQEALDTLRGDGPPDLWELSLTLGSYLLALAGVVSEPAAARSRLTALRDSGAALERFAAMVAAQRGDRRVVDEPALLPRAALVDSVASPHTGYVATIDAEVVGRAVAELGAGRAKKGDPIDHTVGVVLHARVGDRLAAGEPLLTIHARAADDWHRARDRLLSAYMWSETPAPQPPLVHRVLGA